MGAAIGPDLAGIGDKPVGRLDFGRRNDLPRALPDWIAAKVSDPRSFHDGLKMPRFGFTKHQTEALTTALLSLGREPVPVEYQVPARTASYTPPGHFGELVRQYRCLSCHEIDGVGGNISTAPLTAEGSKVRPAWLADYLKLPTTVRPIVEERMLQLQMPDEERAFIANFVENVLRNDSIPDEIFPQKPAAEDVERGRKLFHERYGCQACHMVGGHGGFYGPVLDGAGARLKTGWIYTWLKGPRHLKADAQEPDYGLDDADARALTAYVASIPAPSTTGGKK
jgi:mono/diheme cytochrome c family protein